MSEWLDSRVSDLVSKQHNRLLRSLPMKWLNIPQSGSSFINVLTHHVGICPDFPEDSIIVRQGAAYGISQSDENLSLGDVQDLMLEEIGDDSQIARDPMEELKAMSIMTSVALEEIEPALPKYCPNRIMAEANQYFGLPSEEFRGNYSGRIVMMMKQPEQRILSAFSDDQAGCPGCKDEVEFAPRVAGCVTKTLTRSSSKSTVPCLDESAPHPTHHEVALASERLAHDVAFVGIVEEWDLSVCLFHAMFGGECQRIEILDAHPPVEHYDVSRLDGFRDTYDGPIYQKAKEVFWSRLAKYKVTHDACRAMCK